MATKEEIQWYKDREWKRYKAKKAHTVLNVLTGIFGIIWPVFVSVCLLQWTFTVFLRTSTMQQVATIFSCMGFTAACIVMIAMGIVCTVKAYWEIDSTQGSVALGVCLIIFAAIIPGVLYLVTRRLYMNANAIIEDPEARDARVAKAERERKSRERKEKDPRRFFTQDEDDVGEIPDINRIDFKDLKAALDAEEEEEKENNNH